MGKIYKCLCNLSKLLWIILIVFLVGGCSQNSEKMQKEKAEAAKAEATKIELLNDYKKSCKYRYNDLADLFDKADKTVENVWAGKGKRPEMPWKEIRDRQLGPRYLSQQEFKITQKATSIGANVPSSLYHQALVSYEHSMIYLTGQKFGREDYEKVKAEINSGRNYMDQFRRSCERFP